MKLKTSRLFDKQYKEYKKDTRLFGRLIDLIRAVVKSPTEGIGKPESLKYYDVPTYSRRIDRKNQLVYSLYDDLIFFRSCRGHYDDK